jgi:multiple sugar transport system permease protein
MRLLASASKKEAIEGYLFISPWLLGFLIFTLGPLIASIFISLSKWDIFSDPQFVGIENYIKMFSDPLFKKSLWNTFYYSVFSIPLGMAGGLSLALLLNQQVKGLPIFRTLFYLPSVTSGVAVALLWKWIFNPEFGIANAILNFFGLPSLQWLNSPTWAMPALIIMSLWGVGGGMLIYLAGLQGIPKQLYEAAELDGAGTWSCFINITLPMLSPTLFFQLITGIIGSFQIFTQAFVMTNGGPVNATLFYVLYLYRNAFQSWKMGYASALAWFLFIVILILTLIQFRLSKRWVHYDIL